MLIDNRHKRIEYLTRESEKYSGDYARGLKDALNVIVNGQEIDPKRPLFVPAGMEVVEGSSIETGQLRTGTRTEYNPKHGKRNRGEQPDAE